MGGISSVLGTLALLGFLAFIAGVALVVLSASQGRPTRQGISLALVGILVGLVFSVISQGILIVQPTEVAVVFNTLNGTLEDPPRRAGTSIVAPVVQTYTIMPISQQTYVMSSANNEGDVAGDDAVSARTSDGQEIKLDVSVIYGVDPTKANTVYTRWRDRYTNDFVRPTSRGIVREVVSGFAAQQIYGADRATMEQQAQDKLAARMQDEGLLLTDLIIRDITFSPEFAASIERAQIAQQDSEQARFRVQQRLQEADQARAVAAGQRDAAIAAAQGEAQSIILKAQAEAEGLRLVSQQIAANPALIQYQYIQKLSDKIQLALVPANGPFLFDFASLAKSNPNFTAPDVPSSSLDLATPEPTPPVSGS